MMQDVVVLPMELLKRIEEILHYRLMSSCSFIFSSYSVFFHLQDTKSPALLCTVSQYRAEQEISSRLEISFDLTIS